MGSYRIGQVARAAGVAVDTVRYYEREGLLPRTSRSASGYRQYSPADIARVRFIRQAKALGFTLDDIAELLSLQDGGGLREQVRARAQDRVAELDRRISELTAIRDALAALVKQCHGTGPVAACPIIEGVQAVRLTGNKEN